MQDGSAKQQTSEPGCGERPAAGVRSGGEAKADERRTDEWEVKCDQAVELPRPRSPQTRTPVALGVPSKSLNLDGLGSPSVQ